MTCCIIHKSGWTVADTRGMEGARVLPCVFKKVVRVGVPTHTLVAIAGQASIIHDFEAIKADAGEDVNVAPELFRQAIQELKPESAGVCMVNSKQEIWSLDQLGAASKLTPETEFEVLGSGAEIAYGYLYRCQQLNGHITQEDAKAAIVAVSTRDVSVGPESLVETLYN